MKRSTARSLSCALAPLVLCALGAGCVRPPTEKPVYAEARRAIKAYVGEAADVKIRSISESKLYIGKSAARADLKATTRDARGQTIEKRFTVQLKRVARTWVAQDVSVTPGSEGFPADTRSDGLDLMTP